jgi:hypothetical protein
MTLGIELDIEREGVSPMAADVRSDAGVIALAASTRALSTRGLANAIKLTEMTDAMDTMGFPPVSCTHSQGTPRTGLRTPLARRCATEHATLSSIAARVQHAAL